MEEVSPSMAQKVEGVKELVQGDVEGYVSVIAKCVFLCKVHRSLMNVANI